MRVRELVEALQLCDPEARVYMTLKAPTDFYEASDFAAAGVVERGFYEPDLACPPFVGEGDPYRDEEERLTEPAICLWARARRESSAV